MDDRQRRENERNIRSDDFLTTNIADFAQNEVAQAKIGYLTEKVNLSQIEMQKQMAGEDAAKIDVVNTNDLLDALLDEMRDVRDFANSMAQDDPLFEEKFRLPRSYARREIIAAARVFADEAEPIKQSFIDFGMDADFIVQLRAKADALENAIAAAEETIGTKVGATNALEIAIREANRTVEALDPIVRRTYRANPTKLSAWIYASHVERRTPKPKNKKNGDENS